MIELLLIKSKGALHTKRTVNSLRAKGLIDMGDWKLSCFILNFLQSKN